MYGAYTKRLTILMLTILVPKIELLSFYPHKAHYLKNYRNSLSPHD
jgi:hypothetical protein